ncbi:MAG: class I SAM-dependent methyltransferase [Coleofasciculus sp. G1-WW12-02]|uniref:class I SAM-dependent methyltransferase n=1 Tax=Coleofasciculus sp. G1-WW12-02 TaxID=3068483 RepID=UPI0032FF087B
MILDRIALKYLNWQRQLAIMKMNSDTDKPIQLIKEYLNQTTNNPEYLNQVVLEFSENSTKELSNNLIYKSDYNDFKKEINTKLKIFTNKPYQLGAIDIEIDAIAHSLAQFEQPDVLEIGVANGYSSAFLYYVLDKIGGSITSLDLPRFSSSLSRPRDWIRTGLASKGKIKNTGTLGDLNPGGVIPAEKYGGWLIPMHLRTSVKNTTIYGDALIILENLPGERFNFAVLDAMKGYESRMKIMEMIWERLRPNSLAFVDGYWVNSAFEDFCNLHHLPSWKLGRVGVFVKSI